MPDYFQDHMPDNVCFGCGTMNHEGLQIKSYWDESGEQAICVWQPEHRYRGWHQVLNGGILATLIDCHSMGAALAAAYQAENRPIGSQPVYRYATGTISVRYLKPTPMDTPIELRARVLELSGRKARVVCDVFAQGDKTAEADVVGIRVLEGEAAKDDRFKTPGASSSSQQPPEGAVEETAT